MKIMKYDEYHGIIEDDGHQFSFYWSGVYKDDALRLLGLESCSDIDILFNGVE